MPEICEQIRDAAEAGNAALFTELFEADIAKEHRLIDLETRGKAFSAAAKSGNRVIFDMLDKDDDTQQVDQKINNIHRMMALRKALCHGHAYMVNKIEDHDSKLLPHNRMTNHQRGGVLVSAVESGNLPYVTTMLNKHINISAEHRKTALTHAVTRNHRALVKMLVNDDRTRPMAKRMDKGGALSLAAESKDRSILLMILASEEEAERLPMLQKAFPEMDTATCDAILSATVAMEHAQKLGPLMYMDKLFSHTDPRNCLAKTIPTAVETRILDFLTGENYHKNNQVLTKRWEDRVATKNASNLASENQTNTGDSHAVPIMRSR